MSSPYADSNSGASCRRMAGCLTERDRNHGGFVPRVYKGLSLAGCYLLVRAGGITATLHGWGMGMGLRGEARDRFLACGNPIDRVDEGGISQAPEREWEGNGCALG